MRPIIKFGLSFVALLFCLTLATNSAWAGTAQNCPTEPASNVPIADGQIYTGSNCNLYTVADVDSFVFSGTNGYTYQLAAAVNGGSNNICMTVYNGTTQIYTGCTNIGPGNLNYFSVVTDLTLTTTGNITIDISEEAPSATQNYAVSMERIYPAASNAVADPKQGDSLAGSLPDLTDSNEWTFNVATTGEYAVTATLPSDATQNLCLAVYQPGGASAGSECTNIGPGFLNYYTVSIDFTPTANGTSIAFVSVDGNDATIASYNLEVECLVGTCPPFTTPPPTPKCTDSLSYSSGTLTMNFTLGTPVAATWNGWLTTGNTIQQLWSTSEPKTEPAVKITETESVPASGDVGVLSTLTTATNGIICSSWELINTGKPASPR
jgi:hypothetical protein